MKARPRAVLSVAALALVLTAGTAAAQESGTEQPVTVSINDLLPRDPRPGEALQVLGTLRNSGGDLTGVQVRVRVGDRLRTRGQLRQADAEPPDHQERDTQELPDLPAGGTAPLDLRMPVDELELGEDGVYPVQVQVRAYGEDGRRAQVGAVDTYLPWFGGDGTDLDPLRVAWLWPLVDEPRRSPREVMLDDALAASLAPAGRLGRSLQAGRSAEAPGCPPGPASPLAEQGEVLVRPPESCRPVPVTWAVDPELLFSAEAMTRDYPVAAGRGTTRPGAGVAAARTWLGELQQAAAVGDVLALPFADPDVVALTRRTGTVGDVAVTRQYGDRVAREVLQQVPLQDVAFPPAGPLTEAALDALGAGQTRAVVLDEQALVGTADAGYTPGTRAELPAGPTSGPLTGLVVEPGLSELLTADVPGGPRLAEQRWLVETAMIAAERPNRGRTLLVAPPRRGDVDPARLGPVLADTGRLPWLCPVPLEDVVAARESCPGRRTPSYEPERDQPLAEPTEDDPELDARDLQALRPVREAAAQLTGSVLRAGTPQSLATRSRMQRAWMRAQSSAWREERSRGARLTGLLREDVVELRGRVRVLTSPTTLTSRTGRISVAVVNELDQPVTVQVRLRAANDARLSARDQGVLEVAPRDSLPVEFDVRTDTSGRFLVRAQLLDRDGRPVGAAQDLPVNSTRYGTAALAVTGVGAAVLFAAAGARLVRRGLARQGRDVSTG